MKRLFFTMVVTFLILPAVNAGNLRYEVIGNETGMWYVPQIPEINIMVYNTTSMADSQKVQLQISTDKGKQLYNFTRNVNLASGDSLQLDYKFNLTPGFYKCTIIDNDSIVQSFNVGYEPENIVSLPDAQSDFNEFWNKALAELAQVAPKYSIIEVKEKSGKIRKTYLVKMRSLDNEEIQGYLVAPIKKGTYMVKLYYMGYGSKPWSPSPDENAEMVEFVLSTRGQGLCSTTNKYGDWIVNNLNDKDKYYYRGAFMDLVRAIDFICTLPYVDTKNIFAEGGSQGGAFTLAACALDNRIAAGAPYIPFLSDYPDYFDVALWPGNVIKNKQKELNMSDDELYRNLSYFDIKNFAGIVKCPILMGVGLQDPVCPPHTNFSSYNLLNVPKEYIIYRDFGHDVRRPDWDERVMKFFLKYKR